MEKSQEDIKFLNTQDPEPTVGKNINEQTDEIVEQVGSFGPFQWILLFTVHALTTAHVMNYFLLSFATLDSTPEGHELLKSKDSCQELPQNDSGHFTNASNKYGFQTLSMTFPQTVCELSHFDREKFLVTLTQIVMVISIIFYGFVNDVLGRKLPIFLGGFLGAMCGLLTPFCSSFYSFSVLYLLSVFFYTACIYPALVFVMECTSGEHRLISLCAGAWVSGFLGSGVTAYLTLSWQGYAICSNALGLVASLPILIFPESPRWLISKRKGPTAVDALYRIARINRTLCENLKSNIRKNVERIMTLPAAPSSKTSLQIRLLLRNQKYWLFTLTFWFLNFVKAVAGVGALFNLGMFVSNPFLLVIVFGLFQIWQPLVFVPLDYKCPNFSRKALLGSSMIMCVVTFSLGFLCSVLADNGIGAPASHAATAFLIIIGNSVGWGIMNTATNMVALELYPTAVRAIGSSALTLAGGVGSIAGPSVLGANYGWAPMPHLLVALGYILATATVLAVIPETKGKALPHTVDDHGKTGDARYSDINSIGI